MPSAATTRSCVRTPATWHSAPPASNDAYRTLALETLSQDDTDAIRSPLQRQHALGPTASAWPSTPSYPAAPAPPRSAVRQSETSPDKVHSDRCFLTYSCFCAALIGWNGPY